jgi:iron(II)-dependent oxidoreductase
MITKKSIGVSLVIGFLVVFGCVEEKGKAKSFPQTYPEDMPKQIVSEKDDAKMVLIPAGKFQMGTDSAEIPGLVRMAEAEVAKSDAPPGFWVWSFEDETPRHTVYLDPFYMDMYEVTNAQYRIFIQATDHHEPKATAFVDGNMQDGFEPWTDERLNKPDQPVVCVNWKNASAYAAWAGKRLPTEAEWEKAARGGLVSKRYPWGDAAPDGTQCNFADRKTDYIWSDNSVSDGHPYTAPVGSFAPNAYGLYDMAGNVYEWCADWFGIDYYTESPERNPKGPSSGDVHILRGGAWALPPSYLRCAYRAAPAYTHHYYGFRCVQDVIH